MLQFLPSPAHGKCGQVHPEAVEIPPPPGCVCFAGSEDARQKFLCQDEYCDTDDFSFVLFPDCWVPIPDNTARRQFFLTDLPATELPPVEHWLTSFRCRFGSIYRSAFQARSLRLWTCISPAFSLNAAIARL
jgi:hypothetical protein